MIWVGLLLLALVVWWCWPVRRLTPIGRFLVTRDGKPVYVGDQGSLARQVYEQSERAELWDRGICRGRK